MTKMEYLEYVQEALAHPTREAFEVAPTDPKHILFCTPEEHARLETAHQDYVDRVREILFGES